MSAKTYWAHVVAQIFGLGVVVAFGLGVFDGLMTPYKVIILGGLAAFFSGFAAVFWRDSTDGTDKVTFDRSFSGGVASVLYMGSFVLLGLVLANAINYFF